jgi:hypothetical protein
MRCGVLCLYNFDVDRPRDDLFPTRRANPRYQSPNATSLNRPTFGDRAGSLKGRFWIRPARTQPARSRCTSAARTIAFDAYVGKLKDARPSDNIYPHFLPRDARANSRWLVQHGFAGEGCMVMGERIPSLVHRRIRLQRRAPLLWLLIVLLYYGMFSANWGWSTGNRWGSWRIAFEVLGLIGYFAVEWKIRQDTRELRRRAAMGLCLHCGYDLRASPERCPECGRPAENAAIT